MKFRGIWLPGDWALLWVFPILAVYLIGMYFNAPVLPIVWSVRVLAAVGLIFAYRKLKNIQRFSRIEAAFCFLLLLFIFLPGAYLEFPADNWEHLRRIVSWNRFGSIEEQALNIQRKFTYFFWFSFLPSFEPPSVRAFAGLVSGLSQILVLSQFLRVAKRLLPELDRPAQLLHLFAFLCFFGTSTFGLRYYGLSSTPLALAAHFAGLAAFLDFLGGKPMRLVAVFFYGTLAYFAHFQALIYLVLMIAVAGLHFLFTHGQRRVRFTGYGLLTVLGLSLLVQGLQFSEGASARFLPEQISIFRSFRIWSRSFPWLETVGIHGVLAIFFAVAQRKRRPRIFWFTLSPTFLLIMPFSSVLISALVERGEIPAYRILYAFPLSLALVEGLRALASRFRYKVLIPLAVIVLLAASPFFPWRGRLQNQVYVPNGQKALEQVDAAAVWLKNNKPDVFAKGSPCRLLADDITYFGLNVFLAGPFEVDSRRTAQLILGPFKTAEDILASHKEKPVCGILLAKEESPVFSFMGRTSGHWAEEAAAVRHSVPEAFRKAVRGLAKKGWRSRDVSSFYEWWEP